MKTISQMAKGLGVSKAAVRRYLTDEIRAGHTELRGGVIYIDEIGEGQIRSRFRSPGVPALPESSGNVPDNVSGNVSGVSDTVSALISTLQRQLEEKDRQIAEKDRQISDLIQSNLRLLPPPEPKKAGLWAKIFRRRQ